MKLNFSSRCFDCHAVGSGLPYGVSMSTRRHPGEPSDLELLEQFSGCLDDCVVECASCAVDHAFNDLAADVLAMPPRYFLCPLCRGDLAEAVRNHLQTCYRSAGPRRTP